MRRGRRRSGAAAASSSAVARRAGLSSFRRPCSSAASSLRGCFERRRGPGRASRGHEAVKGVVVRCRCRCCRRRRGRGRSRAAAAVLGRRGARSLLLLLLLLLRRRRRRRRQGRRPERRCGDRRQQGDHRPLLLRPRSRLMLASSAPSSIRQHAAARPGGAAAADIRERRQRARGLGGSLNRIRIDAQRHCCPVDRRRLEQAVGAASGRGAVRLALRGEAEAQRGGIEKLTGLGQAAAAGDNVLCWRRGCPGASTSPGRRGERC